MPCTVVLIIIIIIIITFISLKLQTFMNEKILKNFENVPIGNVFYKSDQIGNVLTNVFMYFFAALIELHSLIVIGARFQILAASLIKHCVCSFD